jgi:hypothetical protein
LIVEPEAAVVQCHPRRQVHPQTLKLIGTLPPESVGVEELVVEKLSNSFVGVVAGVVTIRLNVQGWLLRVITYTARSSLHYLAGGQLCVCLAQHADDLLR